MEAGGYALLKGSGDGTHSGGEQVSVEAHDSLNHLDHSGVNLKP